MSMAEFKDTVRSFLMEILRNEGLLMSSHKDLLNIKKENALFVRICEQHCELHCLPFFKRVKKQKFSETAWLTPFLCLVCADKMLLGGFNSISLLNPPPHCSKTQHPELILNVV